MVNIMNNKEKRYYVSNVVEHIEEEFPPENSIGFLRVFTIPEAAQEWIEEIPNAKVFEYKVIEKGSTEWPKKIPVPWEVVVDE